jgi:hypothetical protein
MGKPQAAAASSPGLLSNNALLPPFRPGKEGPFVHGGGIVGGGIGGMGSQSLTQVGREPWR